MEFRAPEVAVVWDQMGCKGWGWAQGWAVAPAADAGHALLDANTPPISPGPRRHAWPCRQTGGRFVRVSTRSWNARPVTTHYTENNWEKIVQEAGACGEISKFPSTGSGVGVGTGRGGAAWDRGGRHRRVSRTPVSRRGAARLCGEGCRTRVPAQGWWRRGPRPRPRGGCRFSSGIGAPPGCA